MPEDLVLQVEAELRAMEMMTKQNMKWLSRLKKRSRKGLDSAKQLRAVLEPVNLQLLVNLLRRTRQDTELIKDKDVAILLGTTGVGKSTTVQYLCGVDFEMISDTDGDDVLRPTVAVPGHLKRFEAANSTHSVTQNLSAVSCTWTPSDGDDQGRHFNAGPRVLWLCDAPGYVLLIRWLH